MGLREDLHHFCSIIFLLFFLTNWTISVPLGLKMCDI